MDNYKRNIAKQYRDLSDKIESLEKTLSNPQFEKNVGEEMAELTRQRLAAMLTELDILSKQVRLLEPFNCDFGNCKDPKNENYLDRDMILAEAEERCLCEMYRKSQPAGDYNEYVRKLNEGEIVEEIGDEIYRRHYLSQEETNYLLEKYIRCYGMYDKWNDYFDLLVEYMKENGKVAEKDSFRDLPHIKYMISETIKEYFFKEGDHEKAEEAAEKISNLIFNRIEQCRNFYSHGREENNFKFHMLLSYGSPTTNKETVKAYWANKGIDIEIVDRDPDKFWSKDYYEELNE